MYSCNLVEKLLFTLCKRFADDLVRQTCADIYFANENTNKSNKLSKNLKKQSSSAYLLNENFDLILSQKFPASLSVVHIYNTIKTHEKFDFLTNKYMANSIKTSTKESNSDHNATKSDVNFDLNDQLYKNNSKKLLINK